MFEGNYGNLTFAHVIAFNCSWIFFIIIIYLFGLVLWFFCFLCHSVSNSRQNVEVYMSYWVLLWKLQGYKGNCFQSTRKEILGNTHVTNSNQILLSFTFVSYSLDIMLKLKADFFYPQDKGNEIHSLLLLQQVWHDLFLCFNCQGVDRSPRKVRIQPGEEKGSLHVLWVVLQAYDEILDWLTLVADLVDCCK